MTLPLPLALAETWYLFFLCMSIALTAWMVFIWAVRTGQFKDTEETAERMLELDERDEALPDPEVRSEHETQTETPGSLGVHVAEDAVEDAVNER